MTSVENVESNEVGGSHTLPLSDSDYIVDESEAKEIDSCLNFLSILDDESSNDSCDFTLFRKKSDDSEKKSDEKGSSSKTNESNSSSKTVESDSSSKTVENDSSIKTVESDLSSKTNESERDGKVSISSHKDENQEESKTYPNVVSPRLRLIEYKKKSLNLNSEGVCSVSQSDTCKKTNFKVIRNSPDILKVSSISDGTSSTLSKKEGSSMLRSAKVIVLKVPTPSPEKPNTLKDKSPPLADKESQNDSNVKKSLSILKFPTTKTSTPLSQKTGSFIIKSINDLKLNKFTDRNRNGALSPSFVIKSTMKSENKEDEKGVKQSTPSSLVPNGQIYSDLSAGNSRNVSIVVTGRKCFYIKDKKNIRDNDLKSFRVKNLMRDKLDPNTQDLVESSNSEEVYTDGSATLCADDVIRSKESKFKMEASELLRRTGAEIENMNLENEPIIIQNETHLNNVNNFPPITDISHSKSEAICTNESTIPCTDNSISSNESKFKIEASELISKTVAEISNLELESQLAVVNDMNIEQDNTCFQEESTLEVAKPSEKSPLITDSEVVTHSTTAEERPKEQLSEGFDKSNTDVHKHLRDSKKIKTRLVAGDSVKANGKKRYQKTIDMSKRRRNTAERTKGNKEKGSSQKNYTPLIRTELPTFVQKLGSDDTDGRKHSENTSLHADTVVGHENSTSDSKSDHPVSEKVTNQTSEMEMEDFESISFSPIRPGNLENFSWSNDEEETFSKITNELASTEPKEDSNGSNPAASVVTSSAENDLRLPLPCTDFNNPFSSREIILNRDDAFSNDTSNTLSNPKEAKSDDVAALDFPAAEVEVSTTLVKPIFYEEPIPGPNDMSSKLSWTNKSEVIKSSSESEKTTNISNNLKDSETSPNSKPAFEYSFNKASPLSFSVQNVLENMFKYESFASSTNMARLAKIMDVQWKDVRDWFVARRSLNKKNGIFPRNQSLTTCPYCPEYEAGPEDSAIVHLMSFNHIRSMMMSMHKDNLIFSKFQNEGDSKGKHGLNAETGSTTLSPNETQLTQEMNSNSSSNQTLQISHYKTVCEPTISYKSRRKKDKLKPMKHLKQLHQMDANIYIGYRCPDCSKIFQSEWLMMRHSITHKKLICYECSEVFAREDLLQHHFKEHLIESMDDELYPMYLCSTCFNLDCICPQENRCVQPTMKKHFIRPQIARRSKPFLSAPYSGVNEHLKVTMTEFWNEFKAFEKDTSSTPLIREKEQRLHVPSPSKDEKVKAVRRAPNVTPTYTNTTTFNCDLCESFFFTEDELTEHIIVHRIQARSREKKNINKDITDSEFLKPAAPDPLYFCSYCAKGFRRESTLFKHLKLECKSLPSQILQQISNGVTFHLEKTAKNRHFKIKFKTQIQTNFSKRSKCNLCSSYISKNPYLKHICTKKIIPKSTTNERGPVTDRKSHENDLITHSHYLLCGFCSIPMSSESQLHSHIQNDCSSTPENVKTDLVSYSLSELVKLGRGVHFKKVKRDALSEVISPRKLLRLLDINNFQTSKSSHRRFICKFCAKEPLKHNLRLHLLSHCKSIPEEFRALIHTSNARMRKTFKEPTDKIPDEPTCTNDVAPQASKSSTVESTEDPPRSISPQNIKTEKSPESHKSNMLYDCHLCEEKFKISKDFISHMSNFHCMNISVDSSYKWLSDGRGDSDSSPTERESPMKSSNMHGHLVNLNSPTERESPMKTSNMHGHLVNLMEQDANLDNIAEMLIVSDFSDLEKKDPSTAVEPTRAVSKRKVSGSLPGTPSKSQKLDDELLGGDLDNLDSFIETVQLEDSTFVDSMS